MKRLVRRWNQPITARLIKTAKSSKISQEIDGFFSLQRFRVGSLARLSEEHEGMISLVKRCHMMYHVKNYNVEREKSGQRTLTRGKWNNWFVF